MNPSQRLPVSSNQALTGRTPIAESAHQLPSAGNARRQPRSSMFLTAVILVGREQSPVKVRNMSPSGAMVETTVDASPGTNVKLVRGRLVAEGSIVWTSGNRHGVKFDVEVSVQEWLAGPAKAEQNRIDDIVSLIKAGRVVPQVDGAEPPISAEGRQSNEQSAIDLEAVVNLIQDLEEDLASSPETLMRHQVKLQNLDIAMQMLRAVAEQLSPGQGDRPSIGADLDNLRVVCGRAMGSRPG